ncbi:serine/threonine protein kinase [Nonomuraea mesophila]|uniref:Serine/threonine protein kinase n=1 Tax=Nonomuraea mesophila TaxID=2530382 RepID=A0A4R5FS83_9ACTN|nr:serine/threonine-protein kinase [Nonomuraea mesophila]TDE55656.1 serine/threonine protein kinase [Nonomuraea mesophila]
MTHEPQHIGPYSIVRPLGEGGMGIVYLARDRASHLVAVKTLRPGLGADADFRRRFTREIEAARSVARFCTAPVLDAGIDGDLPYLVTDYVEGPDLAGEITRKGPMTGANLEALAVGVATALTAIHHAGIVHRDLKPANILLSSVGPRVIDFGIAQLVEPDATRSASVVGTPAYMSPEQATGGQVTAAGDVFAWGGVVAYASTGRAPFGTGGAPEVLFRVVHYAPDLHGMDERLRPLVEQALAKEPERRPTAQQLLDRLLGREAITAATATHLVSDSWSALMSGGSGASPEAPGVPSPASGASPGVQGPASGRSGGKDPGSRPGGDAEPVSGAGGSRPGPTKRLLLESLSRHLPGPLSRLLPYRKVLRDGGTLSRGRWRRSAAAAGAVLLASAGTAVVLWQTRQASPPSEPRATAVSSQQVAATVTPRGATRPPRDPDALAQHKVMITNVSGAQVPLYVTIDKVVQVGDQARFEATVTNIDSTGARADLDSILGTPASDLRDITLAPYGTTEPLHPVLEDEVCTCTTWSSRANAIDPDESVMLHATFSEVPLDAGEADLHLLGLGTFRGLPLNP